MKINQYTFTNLGYTHDSKIAPDSPTHPRKKCTQHASNDEFRLSIDQSQAELMIGNYAFLSSFSVVVGYIRPVDGVRLKSNSLGRV